jgi:hypothetical protein
MKAIIDDIQISANDIATVTLIGPHGHQVTYAEAPMLFDALEWLGLLHGAWQGATFDVEIDGDMLLSIDQVEVIE